MKLRSSSRKVKQVSIVFHSLLCRLRRLVHHRIVTVFKQHLLSFEWQNVVASFSRDQP
jgi:hypothetical protein